VTLLALTSADLVRVQQAHQRGQRPGRRADAQFARLGRSHGERTGGPGPVVSHPGRNRRLDQSAIHVTSNQSRNSRTEPTFATRS
jgi:hypothetical protein